MVASTDLGTQPGDLETVPPIEPAPDRAPGRPWEFAFGTPPGAPEPPPPARTGGRFRGFAVPLVAALLGAALGTAGTLAVDRPRSGGVVRVAAPQAGIAARQTGVAAVAAAVLPSVVRIDVAAQGRFGRQVSGTGSGVIYRPDGYILTNNHVVDGASSVQVTLSTGEKLSATVVGTAAPTDDIAVVKVERAGLPAATLGSTGALNVGDLAVAIGSPFGLQGTVTAGVISALHRNIDFGQGERFADAIQTDAPINPGNSGGALAAADGSVIGINTAIVGSDAGNVGVGFAIPIDIARRDADQIIATGSASRPFLGISGESIPGGGGALIQDVTASGPAANAGLQVGDTIVALGETKITSMDDLVAAITKLDVGQKIRIAYLRGGERRTTEATLAALPRG